MIIVYGKGEIVDFSPGSEHSCVPENNRTKEYIALRLPLRDDAMLTENGQSLERTPEFVARKTDHRDPAAPVHGRLMELPC